MRKVVLGVGVSLDSYIARPNGAVDFLLMPKDYSMAGLFARIDTAVMGRNPLAAIRRGQLGIVRVSSVSWTLSVWGM